MGLGYNIKMLEAYLVVPAFGLLYLLASPRRWGMRVGHPALATIVLLVVSLSWSVAVDSVPVSQRPYVGSSSTNSELNLAFGYNGLERITGLFGLRGLTGGNAHNVPPTVQPNPGEIGGLTGTPGPQRLIDDALGGQVSWLLPLAVLGLLASGWQMRPEALTMLWRTRRSWSPVHMTQRQQAFVLWGMWFLTQTIFFSVAAFFQSYYLVMLAPAIAALAGIGAVELWHDYRRPGWRGWLLPTALVLTALLQAHLIAPYADYSRWLIPLVVGGSLLASGVLTWLRLTRQVGVDNMLRVGATTTERRRVPLLARLGTRVSLPTTALAIGMAAVLVAPTAWSLATVQYADNGFIPVAGPAQQNNLFVRLVQVVITSLRVDPSLVSYLETHQGNAHYLVATLNALTAAPIILESGKPVMALGGFSGIDQILTTNQLANLVESGEVRYFWLPSSGSFFLSPSMIEELPPQFQELFESAQIQDLIESVRFNSDLTDWVNTHCTVVSANQWSSPGNSAGFNPGGTSGGSFEHSMGQQLYDCASHG
jgi:4-amino-4-deoxy-L-arabinose transferase-like glycosyltransferase